jgi:uncharacterized protein DUF3179
MRHTPYTFLFLAVLTSAVHAQPALPFGEQGWRTDWTRTAVDYSELEVNVPRDAIAPIDAPQFITPGEAAMWLSDQEPVVRVQLGSESRAYPLQILTWHEIVNDRIGDTPVTVTFCPLCYSAIAFDRLVDGDVLDFGVSGMLRHSDLVMYDRQTHSLWQQLTGEAIVGSYMDTRLNRIPAQIISFKQFREAHPAGSVLSRETGHQRDYGRNPYAGYDDISKQPWLYRGPSDGRLPPMEKVVGITIGESSKAYSHRMTRQKRVIRDRVGDTDLVIFHSRKGATSALDAERIADSRVIGSTGVFSPHLGNRTLTFTASGSRFKDQESGTVWDVTGLAVEGELTGSRLTPLPHADVFAFAWFVMIPDTELYNDD